MLGVWVGWVVCGDFGGVVPGRFGEKLRTPLFASSGGGRLADPVSTGGCQQDAETPSPPRSFLRIAHSLPGTDASPMQSRLKLYTGEETPVSTPAVDRVSISLGELAAILTDATQSRRAWLRDFDTEDVEISSDLFEVLSTYWNLRRRRA